MLAQVQLITVKLVLRGLIAPVVAVAIMFLGADATPTVMWPTVTLARLLIIAVLVKMVTI